MPGSVALFRHLALSLPGAVEGSHFSHPDFRWNNRIFATLSAKAKGCGVVLLTREQQAGFVADLPEVFEPVPGGWGQSGSTLVHLAAAGEQVLLGALTTAYRNVEAKQTAKRKTKDRPASKSVIKP